MNVKAKILPVLIFVFASISFASGDKLLTREDYEQKIEQQRQQIRNLEKKAKDAIELRKTIVDLKSQLFELKYGSEHKPERNETGNTKDKQSENSKFKTIIQDQKKQIQRFRSLFRQMGIDPGADVNAIPLETVKYAIKDYKERVNNFKTYSHKKKYKSEQIDWKERERSIGRQYNLAQNLRVGEEFKLTEKTPLMPEFNPANALEAIGKIRYIAPGATIKVLKIKKRVTNTPWYYVEVKNHSEMVIAKGWINSIGLMRQD